MDLIVTSGEQDIMQLWKNQANEVKTLFYLLYSSPFMVLIETELEKRRGLKCSLVYT